MIPTAGEVKTLMEKKEIEKLRDKINSCIEEADIKNGEISFYIYEGEFPLMEKEIIEALKTSGYKVEKNEQMEWVNGVEPHKYAVFCNVEGEL